MTYRKSYTRFRLVPKSTTLNDLEGPLRTLFKNTCVFLGAHHEYLNEDRLYFQRRRCSPMTLDSDVCEYSREFPGKGASYNSGVIENVFFLASGRYVFGALRNEANIITSYHLIPCRLSNDPKMRDRE